MRARRRPQAALLAATAVLALPALPHRWPKALQIGLTESPGTHAPVHLGFRYQSTTSAYTDGGYFFNRVRAYTPTPVKLP